MTATEAESAQDGVPRQAKWLVAGLLVLLLVPGLIGFELWPLTAWRLFSAPRDDTETHYEVEAVNSAGATHLLTFDDLPPAYSNAEWPVKELGGASETRRDEVCQALLKGTVDVRPDTTEVRIVRDDRELVKDGSHWRVAHDREVFHSCRL